MRNPTQNRQTGSPHGARWVVTLGLLFAAAPGCTLVVNTDDLPSCSAHSQCISKHGPSTACIDSRCVPLLSDECPTIEPAPSGANQGIPDNALLLGFVNADDSYGAPQAEGAALAAREIENTGLAGNRKLRLVMCKHSNETQMRSAAAHLVDDLHVPAIVGTSYSGLTIKMFQAISPKGVLIMSPSATSPDITNLERDTMGDLLWRTAPTDLLQGELLKLVTAQLANTLGHSLKDTKVQVFYKDDAAGDGLRKSVSIGSNALDPNGSSHHFWKYPDPDKTSNVEWQAQADKLKAFNPEVILPLGTGEFSRSIMPLIEAGWPQGVRRPFYVMPEGNRVPELAALADSSPKYGLVDRVIGAAPGARRSPNYGDFAASFQGNFGHLPGNLAEFAYDAVYLVAYAVSASKTAPSGEDIAAALKTFSCDRPDATRIDASTFAGFGASPGSDNCLNFDGASGPLEFDTETGEAGSDIAMWCLRHPERGQEAFEPLLYNYYRVLDKTYVQEPDLDFNEPDWCVNAKSNSDTPSSE